MLSDWVRVRPPRLRRVSLNAPYGAPRFLTHRLRQLGNPSRCVLMHLMALRAFWRGMQALLEHLEDAGS